ncbi:MAG: hypothetical protein ACRCYU_23545 [Nocardioides sp.]
MSDLAERLREAAIATLRVPTEDRLDSPLRALIPDGRMPDSQTLQAAARLTGTPVRLGGRGATAASAKTRSHIQRWVVRNGLHRRGANDVAPDTI